MILEKISNGNILVLLDGVNIALTLLPSCFIYRSEDNSDEVIITDRLAEDFERSTFRFRLVDLTSLINNGVPLTLPSNTKDLVEVLSTSFFFTPSSGGSSSGLSQESTQVLAVTALNSILLELKDDLQVTETIWYDKNTPTLFYVRRTSINQDTGVITVTFHNIDGTTATPVIANLVQVIAQPDVEAVTYDYKALATTGTYTVGDSIQEVRLIKQDGTVVVTVWFNKTQNTTIATPTFADLEKDVTLPSGAATEATVAAINNEQLTTTQVTVADSSPGTGTHAGKNTLVGGIYKEDSPILTDGTQSELILDEEGNLKVVIEKPVTVINLEPTEISNFPDVQIVALPQVTANDDDPIPGSIKDEDYIKVGGVDEEGSVFRILSFLGRKLQVIDQTTHSFLATIINRLSRKNSFSISSTITTFTGSTAPFFTIRGNGTKNIKIKSVTIAAPTLTAVAYLTVEGRMYSTAESGGTATTIPTVSYATVNPGSTAIGRAYSVAPTAGTLIGNIFASKILFQATTAVATATQTVTTFTFGNNEADFPTLSNATRTFALAFATAPASATNLGITVELIEE